MPPQLTPNARAWQAAGAREDVLGHRLFVHRHAAEASGPGRPLLVLLHGFPSSSFDWRALLDRLPDGQPVLACDLLGFGLSDKPREHTYALARQADLVTELVRRAGTPPVVLVAHDMGTSVATELLARDIDGNAGIDIRRVLLFNGSMVVEAASLTSGQRLLRSPVGPLAARLSNEWFFRRQFSALFSPSHPLSDEEAADQWALFAHAGGARIAHRLIHYLGERTTLAPRWHGALRDWPGDLRLAWGMLDPVATTNVLRAVRALRPAAPVTELPDLGHYPQIEDPARMAQVVGEALGG